MDAATPDDNDTAPAPAATAFHHACHYGAERIDDATVRFRLWAPDARSVTLRIDSRDLPMRPDGDGAFALTTNAATGSRYRYRIDGTHDVPDPAARAQHGDMNGPSVVVDPAAYRWRHGGWRGRPWHEAVICELHVGTLGGFDDVRGQLQRLADTGYTAIELMPIAEFPGARNWGYDGVLPYAAESSYGPPEALKALIDEAHGLGLMVLLDVVYNHFGPDGNLLGSYAAAFFRHDIRTPWGEAIDFRQAAVRQFFIDNALLWLNEYRFDGLRFDAVHAIQPQDFLPELSAAIRAGCDPRRHVHLILENEHNSVHLLRDSFDAQWNDDGHNALHALLTGEREGYYADFADHAITKLAKVLSEGFLFQGQPDRRGVARGEPSATLPPQAFILFLQNHDQIGNRPLGERLISLIPEAPLRAALALVALSPMVPMFFMGEEWGCRTPFLFFTSHRGDLADRVREGRRAEFAHFAGFADPQRRAKIPDPNAPDTFEASIPQRDDTADATGWTTWFTDLLACRQAHLTPHLPGSRSLGCDVLDDGALVARWRLGDGSELALCLNLGMATVTAALPRAGNIIFAWNASADTDQDLLPPGSLIARIHPACADG
jgi:maltooligosyltrehalose trehalohydrolase